MQNQAPNNQETYDYSSRTPIAQTAAANTVNFIIWGDSLAGANDNATYVPTNLPNVRDYSLQNGGLYQSKAPVIGSTVANPVNNGFWGHRFADKIINGGKASVVNIINGSVGASASGDWTNFRLNYKFQNAFARWKSNGFLNSPTFILASIGGADQQIAVPQATVLANLNSIIATVRSYGFTTTPMYFALSSWANGTGGANGLAVRAAIASAISGNANCYTGADTDTLDASYRYDGNHWNATGSDADAQLWYNIIGAVLP
jgi:hypothetical protein